MQPSRPMPAPPPPAPVQLNPQTSAYSVAPADAWPRLLRFVGILGLIFAGCCVPAAFGLLASGFYRSGMPDDALMRSCAAISRFAYGLGILLLLAGCICLLARKAIARPLLIAYACAGVLSALLMWVQTLSLLIRVSRDASLFDLVTSSTYHAPAFLFPILTLYLMTRANTRAALA